jgi:predicted MFS family arabinose efflux permease
MMSRVGLSLLATAGLFYVNIMPAIVDGLISALGFSNQQAGAVASANIYGAAFGALLIVFIVRRLRWRAACAVFLVALIAIDLASIGLSDPLVLTGVRFLHGLLGGMLVGTAFSVIARTTDPDRTFGVLLFVQFSLGGLGVMFLPGLAPVFGTAMLFISLAMLSAVTLVLLPFLPDYPVQARSGSAGRARLSWPLVASLSAIFLFQGANMGLYAFIIGLGEHFGLALGFITTTLAVSAWIGLAGAGEVIALGGRAGYTLPLAAGLVLTTLGCWAFLHSDIRWVWIAANVLIGVTWAFTIPYLLGLASRFDAHGQMAALAGFASKMGLASGPALFAWLLGEDAYARIIWISVLMLAVCMAAAWAPARLQDRKPGN